MVGHNLKQYFSSLVYELNVLKSNRLDILSVNMNISNTKKTNAFNQFMMEEPFINVRISRVNRKYHILCKRHKK